jgi:peroxiredoxin
MSKTISSFRRADLKSILLLFVVFVFLCWFPSASSALELGSSAPGFSLTNLAGKPISLQSPAKGNLQLLYFFDASEKSIGMLSDLNTTVSKNSEALSLLAISPDNPKKIAPFVADRRELESIILIDHKGTTSAYGLTRKLPAAVIIGSGGIVGAMLTSAKNAGVVKLALADTLISMGFHSRAGKICDPMRTENPGLAEAVLGSAYTSILSGDYESARSILEGLGGGSASEVQAALGFLHFRQNDDNEALAACGRASGRGFADYVAGMVEARSDRCAAASTSFKKAVDARFAFNWQKALALNMAARTAEAEMDDASAMTLYGRAFKLAPLNSVISANLLTCNWQSGRIPAATRYADLLKSIDDKESLVWSLVNEFESEIEESIKKDSLAGMNPGELTSPGNKRNPKTHTILLFDFSIVGCAAESNHLSVAIAGLLKRGMESAGAFVAIRRPEMLAAAKNAGLSQQELEKPSGMARVAKAVSADLMTLGELGNYKGTYYLNTRIASVASGEIIAVTSERLDSLEHLPPAIKKSAHSLAKEISARDSLVR